MNKKKFGNYSLIVAFLFFVIFAVNVFLGGPMRQEPWLSDVQEMLLLSFFVVFFVIGFLCHEQKNKLT